MGKRMRFGLSVLVLATPLLIAACGGGGDDGVAPQPATPQPSGLAAVPDNTTSAPLLAAFAGAPDNLYYNVHTTLNAGGEIRGQLDAGGAVRFATLTQAQETPTPVTTGAFGAGILAVDNVTNRISGYVVTSGLANATIAHIHNGARGVAGPPIVTLTSAGDGRIWVVPDNTISPELVAIFNAAPDNLYFNVHTTLNAGGEIRGQLDAGGVVRFATLTQAQETPTPVTTGAFGAGVVSLDIATNRVGGFVVTSGVANATIAHIHNGARGVAGPPIVTLSSATGSNLWIVPDNTISPGLLAAFAGAQDNLYYNVHTTLNAGGEIRGQLDAGGAVRFATLTQAQETPTPVTTGAFGAGAASLDVATNRVGGFVVTSGVANATVAHIHNGARGVAGPPIVTLLVAP